MSPRPCTLLLTLLTLLSGCASLHQNKIGSFRGRYHFLSNFYPATIEFQGLTYPDVEHAYQSAKTLDMSERRRIATLPTPAEAKKEGESFPPRPDWPRIKYQTMLTCVRYKFFHHPDLARQLLATGNAYLEEGNTWHDQIWGVYQGHGTNWLGKILMQVRAELLSRSVDARRTSWTHIHNQASFNQIIPVLIFS